jgi:hypothetical protein
MNKKLIVVVGLVLLTGVGAAWHLRNGVFTERACAGRPSCHRRVRATFDSPSCGPRMGHRVAVLQSSTRCAKATVPEA